MTIKDYETGEILYRTKIEDEMSIDFSYIHSVSKTPIVETLIVKEDGFHLDKVVYIDQGGAGMPEFAFEDQEFIFQDGKFIIKGFDRFFENIVINVQKTYQDEILVKGEAIDLDKLLGDSNGRVILDTQKIFFNITLK